MKKYVLKESLEEFGFLPHYSPHVVTTKGSTETPQMYDSKTERRHRYSYYTSNSPGAMHGNRSQMSWSMRLKMLRQMVKMNCKLRSILPIQTTNTPLALGNRAWVCAYKEILFRIKSLWFQVFHTVSVHTLP